MERTYTFTDLWRDVRSDLRCCGGTSWIGILTTILWGTSFQLLWTYRLSRWLVGKRLGMLYAPLKWLQYALAGSEISPRAFLGRGVHLPHPNGIVIGVGVVVEDEAWIFQQVTIGSHGRSRDDKAYPVIGRGARIYSGAKVIGGVRVGSEAMVGANSVVLNDVPDRATAVGAPARVVVP
jgi:serine O-acetyltransferase